MKLTRKTSSNAPGLPATGLPIALSLTGIAAAAAVLWITLGDYATQRTNELVASYAQQQVSAINLSLAQLDRDLERVAANPQLQVTLERNDSTPLQRLLRYHGADTLAIYTNAINRAERVENEQAPLNFAALDMIRRAEHDLPVPVEAHKVGNRWLMYGVKPLRASSNAPIGGTLAAVLQVSRVTATLPELPPQAGQVRLIQQFPNAPEQVLFQRGEGSGAPVTLQTANPAWRLEFRPGPAVSSVQPNMLMLGIAALVALVGLMLGLSLLHRSWTRALRADANTLTQLTLGNKAGSIQLGPLEPLPQNIQQLLKRAPESNGADTRAPQGTAAEQPVAAQQDGDVLDIDILDDDPFNMQNPDDTAGNGHTTIPELPAEIFRAYDIRGVVGKSLTEEAVYWLGRAIGSASLDAGEPRVVVGRDGRLSGPALSEQLIQGLVDSGCQVADLGMVPTPVVYFATNTTDATSGVMITGSHNPPAYNGLKIVIAGQTLSGEQITALHQRLLQNQLRTGNGTRERLEILDNYLNHIVEDVLIARPLKVVVDCGNGVGGVIAERLIEGIGCEVIPLFCDVDGLFPNHHPDPGKPENLATLIETVQREGADLGVAFDGDADRLGFVTNSGEMIYPDRLMMLFAEDIVTRNPGADIVFDVKCSRQLPQVISRAGGRPIMWKSGHSLVKAKMKETGALLGGEMSGHLFFKERWFGFDDGLYSACRLLELLSLQPETADEVMARYPASISTPEINITVGEERKFQIIDALTAGGDWGDGEVTSIDGIRVDFANGWGLIRASNTTPVLVLRFEADSDAELTRVQDLFRQQLQTIAPDLQPTF
ncbi:phosphomannomutase/phosphoglucomutase [Halopseudomonas sp.]|uniref:phosphomannomutase/phosphoglucomutase n=1 Tax=Halopseudomonas sp. TaxID=2901191 RepID=UPI0031202863